MLKRAAKIVEAFEIKKEKDLQCVLILNIIAIAVFGSLIGVGAWLNSKGDELMAQDKYEEGFFSSVFGILLISSSCLCLLTIWGVTICCKVCPSSAKHRIEMDKMLKEWKFQLG